MEENGPTVEDMAHTFEKFKIWDDLKNENSDFVKFIKKGFTNQNGVINVLKLKLIGILWCHGTP